MKDRKIELPEKVEVKWYPSKTWEGAIEVEENMLSVADKINEIIDYLSSLKKGAKGR